MASESAPAVINHRPVGIFAQGQALSFLVIEETPVEPESIAEILGIAAHLPLLPVKPPEVNSLTLKWSDDRVEICISPFLLIDAERDRSAVSRLSYRRLGPGKLILFLSVNIVLRSVVVISA